MKFYVGLQGSGEVLKPCLFSFRRFKMIRSFFVVCALLAIASSPAFGQDGLIQRLNNVDARMSSLEAKIDRLVSDAPKATSPAVSSAGLSSACSPSMPSPRSPSLYSSSCQPGSTMMSQGDCQSSQGLLSRIRERRAIRRGY